MKDVRHYYLQTLKTAKIQQFQPIDVADTVAFIDWLDQRDPNYSATHLYELKQYLREQMPDAAALLATPERLATTMSGWMRCATTDLTERMKATWGLNDETARFMLMGMAAFGTTPEQMEDYLTRNVPLDTVLQENKQRPISRSPTDRAETYLSGFYESPLRPSPRDVDSPKAEFEEIALQANSTFQKSLTATLALEGGYANNPADPGGETNRGITRATYEAYLQKKGLPTKVSMRDIPEAHVEDIYRTMFWDRVKGDQLPPKLAMQVFDFAVNSGPDRAIRYLQFLVGTTQDGIIGPKTIAAVHGACTQQGEIQLARDFLGKRREFVNRFASRHPEFRAGLNNRLDAMERMLLY